MKKYLSLSLLIFCAATFAPLRGTAGPILTFSAKGEIGVNHKVLVNEFVITGDQPKKVLLRGIGPGLGSLTSLPDAVLELRGTNGDLLDVNDNWKTRHDGTSQEAEIQATGHAPIHNLDAALIANLSPGTYTAIMRGKAGAVGGGVCDFYDLQQFVSSVPAIGSRLDLDGNSSSPIAFAGFQLTEQRSVVVRVLGPSLGQGSRTISGTVADPMLEIFDQRGQPVPGGQSDNWKTQGGSAGTGLEPTNDAEAAVLLQNLEAGSYTMRVTGKDADGIVFIQIYALPYTTPLDPAPEIGEPYGPPAPTTCVPAPADQLAWYRAEADASDSAGRNDGGFQNGATVALGKVDLAFTFDGIDDFVEVPDAPALNPANGITLEAWVFRTAQSAGDIISKDGEGFARQYILNVGQNNKFRAHIGVPGGLMFVDSSITAPLNTWAHVAMTYEGNDLKLYVNGVLEGSLPVTGPILQTTQPVRIGGGAPAGYPQFFFPGLIDEAGIYDRALTQAEIQSIVQAGSAGKCYEPEGLWVAGSDMAANEKPDGSAETNATNGVVPEWSYGYRDFAAGTAFTPFTAQQHSNAFNTEDIEGFGVPGVPEVAVNVGGQKVELSGNYRPIYPGQMVLHPSGSNAFPVVRWTAPVAGTYRVLAEWLDLDPNGGNGASGHVVVNGTEAFGRKVGPDSAGPERFVGQEWDNGGNAEMPAKDFKLNAGDVIDFAVGSRGDNSFDTTLFNSVIRRVPGITITNAPPDSRTEAGIQLPEGSDITLEAEVNSEAQLLGVALLINGTEGAIDTTPPFSLTETNLRPGTYSFRVRAIDVNGIESVSETITVTAVRIPFAQKARPQTETNGPALKQATSGLGRTFYCSQSGSWHNPATWGGTGGIPGVNDDVVIGRGLAVNSGQDVEVQNLRLLGTLVIGSPNFPRKCTVYKTLHMAGEARGGDPNSQLLVFDRFTVLRGVKLIELALFVSGETLVTDDGYIDGNATMVINGSAKFFPAPGTNRPVTARVGHADITGSLAIDRFAQFIAGGVIARDGASIIGNDSAGIITHDGASIVTDNGAGVIARDGASITGVRGTPLIGLDGSTLIGNDGSTLIGNDGSTLIGNDGSTLASNKTSASPDHATAPAEVTQAGKVTLERALLSGNLTVIGDLVNQGGYVSPGSSAGKITVSGNYIQDSPATLVLEIGGTQTNPRQFDQLQIAGNASLSGNLVVKTIDGYTPAQGDSVSPLDYASKTGTFEHVTSNAQLAFGPNGVQLAVTGANPPPPKALNIATRMKVETGDNALIAGFIITGSQPKKVIIRGIGPSLPFGGVLADPTLSLDNGAITNDNWRTDQEQQIIDSTVPPSNNLEAAIVVTLNPGGHTAVLRGSGNATGIGVVEVYDLESGSPVQLANISSRGFVQTGDDVMIGGFIIGGTYPAKVIVRAIGPSLPVAGKLENPTLELVNQNGGRITNDDWRESQAAEIIATTVPPANDKEAAIVATLAPGSYTAVVRGVDNTTGIAVVEAFNLQ